MATFDFRILGPLEVLRDGSLVPIGSQQQRALLSLLLINANAVVSADLILDSVWEGAPPKGGNRTLHVLVASLRSTLRDGRDDVPAPLVTAHPGYMIQLDPHTLDSLEFIEKRSQALGIMATDPDESARIIEAALAMFRGEPLANVAYASFARAEAERLATLRLAAVEDLMDAKLAAGHARELIAELEALVLEHPYRERFWAQLMLALYRDDRQADALAAYRRARQRLADELGLEPSEALRGLEEMILLRDPSVSRRARRPASVLPALISDIVGREDAIGNVRRLLSKTRLITLVGPAGIGKTTLATECAREVESSFRDGAEFVTLEDAQSDNDIVAAIGRHVLERRPATTDPLSDLVDGLRGLRRLIVLDNCEHLVSEVAEILGLLLHACPELHVMATSREPLQVAGEAVFAVDPLSVPPDDADGRDERSQTEQLFVNRSRLVVSESERASWSEAELRSVCRQLGGLPLAVELVAAQLRSQSLSQIAAALSDGEDFLGYGRRGPLRQRTLEGALDWSYDLLTSQEQALLRRLAVFRGGWDMEAAQEICGFDGIDASQIAELMYRLVDKSMISAKRSMPPRFTMLVPIRQYAAKRLSIGNESATASERHRSYYQAVADATSFVQRVPQQTWLSSVHQDRKNIVAALDGALEENEVSRALDIGFGLRSYWWFAGDFAEMRSRTERLLALDASTDPRYLKAVADLAMVALYSGDAAGEARLSSIVHDASAGAAEDDLRLVDDELRALLALCKGHHSEAADLYGKTLDTHRLSPADEIDFMYSRILALVPLNEIEAAKAELMVLERRVRESELTEGLGYVAELRGKVAFQRGALDDALKSGTAAADRYLSLGSDARYANVMADLAMAQVYAGQLDAADESAQDARQIALRSGFFPGVAKSLRALAISAIKRGAAGSAVPFAARGLKMSSNVLDESGAASSVEILGTAVALDGALEDAAFLLAAGAAAREALNEVRAVPIETDYAAVTGRLAEGLTKRVLEAARSEGSRTSPAQAAASRGY